MKLMAKMVKAFFQGKAWKSGSKRIVAHRNHRVHPSRAKRTRLGSPKFKWHELRGNKQTQKWKRRRNEEIRHHHYMRWQRQNPGKPKKENPYAIKPTAFVNNEMRDALIAAGVVK